jgi:hypothetical protein
MAARLGPGDENLFETPVADLLREVSGIDPEPAGVHVRLDRHAGARSTQRLALGDVGGGLVAALWPAELKSQALYLYADGRAQALMAAARAEGWSVRPSPHLAFYTSSPTQRLYVETQIDTETYARRWEGSDGGWIAQYAANEVRDVLWPWLRERGYAAEADRAALEEFLRILGRRPAHLRPALRLHRRWDAEEVRKLRESGQLPAAVRDAVNRVLRAADEPILRPGLDGTERRELE